MNADTLLQLNVVPEGEEARLTYDQYQELKRLFEAVSPLSMEMDLHEMGGHRGLYNYLTTRLGISVQPGRGPVWDRAKRLVEAYNSRP